MRHWVLFFQNATVLTKKNLQEENQRTTYTHVQHVRHHVNLGPGCGAASSLQASATRRVTWEQDPQTEETYVQKRSIEKVLSFAWFLSLIVAASHAPRSESWEAPPCRRFLGNSAVIIPAEEGQEPRGGGQSQE